MKSFALLCAFAIPAVLAIGCGDDSSNPTDGPSMMDLSAMRDFTMKPCSMAATWPTDNLGVFAGVPQQMGVDWEIEADADNMVGMDVYTLSAQVWYTQATLSPPQTITLDPSSTFDTCDYCVDIYKNLDSMGNPEAIFHGVGGMYTVTKADKTPGFGEMKASGMNIHFVEWDANSDAPVKNGGCYDVTSFSFSGSYSNGDGGTDM